MMISETAAFYAAGKLALFADDMYLEEGVIPELPGEMGLLGITIPKECGAL